VSQTRHSEVSAEKGKESSGRSRVSSRFDEVFRGRVNVELCVFCHKNRRESLAST
jgi:hypothetical protein